MDASDARMRALHPGGSNHLVAVERLDGHHIVLLGALAGDHLAAIGAVVLHDEDVRDGEFKRVFTDPPFRGRGLSKAVTTRLERVAAERGPFGAHAADPLSVFMEQPLAG